MRPFSLCALFLLVLQLLSGQTKPPAVSDDALRRIREASRPVLSDEQAVILSRSMTHEVDSLGRTVEVIYVLGKVFDKQGRADYAQIPLPVNQYYEEARLDFARTIRDDGTTRSLAPDAVDFRSPPQSSGGVIYSDMRFLTFSLPGLEAGVAFEFQVTIVQKRQIIEREWFIDHFFSYLLRDLAPPYRPRMDRVLHSQVVLRVPHGSVFYTYTHGARIDSTRTEVGDVDEYRWTVENIPPVKIEDAMPTLEELSPVIQLTSVPDWGRIDRWAAARFASGIELNDEIRSTAATVTAGATSREEKIRRLFHFVQNQIQYTGADLNRGGFTPHKASEVLSNRYGDCKDQTALLLSLLKAEQIDAYPALLNPAPLPDVTEVPEPFFYHVIAFVPGPERDLWLDTTPSVTEFPRLFFANQDRRAFIVNGTGGRWVRTPASSASDNIYTYDGEIGFIRDRVVVRLTYGALGAASDMSKSVFVSMDPEVQQEMLSTFVTSRFPRAVVDSVTVSDVRNPELPFEASVWYHIDEARMAGSTFVSYRSYAFYPIAFFSNLTNLPPPGSRTQELRFAFPYSITGTERYRQPDAGTSSASLPAADSIRLLHFDLQKRFRRTHLAIIAEWRLTAPITKIPRSDYASFTRGAKDVREALDWTIAFHTTSPEETRDAVQSLVQEASRMDNLEQRQSVYDQATALDPTNVQLRMLSGYNRLQMTAWEQALKDFEAAERALPGSPAPHVGSSFALRALQRKDEAMTHLDKALFLDPLQYEANLARGTMRYDAGDFKGALDDLTQARKLRKDETMALAPLAISLHKLGRDREAMRLFREALAKSPEDLSLNSSFGYALQQMKKYDEALATYEKVLRLDSTSSNAYGNMGWIYYLKGDLPRCLQYSARAVALDSTAFYARHNIALTRLRQGEVALARSLYESSLTAERELGRPISQGAIDDLHDLIKKGIQVEAAKMVLRDYFGVTD